ncbi:MAG TPA: penicillin-binding protein 1B [Candidatus Binatia bacterium]|nr:penicillin-binding protein 1B [Candidatus Binatia bacterium]
MPTLSPLLRRRLWIAAAALLSIAVAALSVWIMLLDRQVRQRFAGARWALPAQVYAAPLEVYPGGPLDRNAFRRELERLGYRAARTLEGPGTFTVGASRIEVVVRPFRFWDGAQPARQLDLGFQDQQIARVTDVAARQDLALVRLDPMLIGSIYPTQGEDRVLVKLDEVPPLLAQGLVLVEDHHFHEHFGLDPKAIARATWANLRAGRAVQGGSTITQQLVRNFFLTLERTWSRKFTEIFMSVLLEAHYSKNEILEAYLNEVHLGQDGGRAVHGFGLASQFYFNKPLAELQPQEIALLVALVKGPSFYNPRKHADRARERRDLVLRMFFEAHLLTPDQLTLATKMPLGVAGEKGGGVARYPAFVDLVKRQLRGQYPEADLTHQGLRIFTTLDPRAQELLERHLLAGLPSLEKGYHMKAGTLESAGVVASVEGGEVLALVGGRDVRYAGFNRALDARRPIGSLAKPFVFLAALMQPDRYDLTTPLEDEPIELELPNGDVWAPNNYDKEIHGTEPLYDALAQSHNLATVRLGLDLGVNNVREMFRAAGTLSDPPPNPSLFLGAWDLAPLEVAQLYSTLAAAGYQTPLLAIREVATQDGSPLTRYPLRVRQTLPESPVYLLNWALERVMHEGTAATAYNILAPELRVAGKTGTTDDLRDSWFAGYGQDRVVVVWLGRDDNQPANLTGAQGALQIWAPLVRDLRVKSFAPVQPANVEFAPGCGGQLAIPYVEGHAPPQYPECAGLKSLFHW